MARGLDSAAQAPYNRCGTRFHHQNHSFIMKTKVIYKCPVNSLTLKVGNKDIDVSSILSNGRVNYTLFEALVENFTGLSSCGQGNFPSLKDEDGKTYEVKSFRDLTYHPDTNFDLFHTAASCLFSPNNKGPLVKKLLEIGDYGAALDVCNECSYDRTDYFIYTNTSGFDSRFPFMFMVFSKQDVLKNLDKEDPRLICRKKLISECVAEVDLV